MLMSMCSLTFPALFRRLSVHGVVFVSTFYVCSCLTVPLLVPYQSLTLTTPLSLSHSHLEARAIGCSCARIWWVERRRQRYEQPPRAITGRPRKGMSIIPTLCCRHRGLEIKSRHSERAQALCHCPRTFVFCTAATHSLARADGPSRGRVCIWRRLDRHGRPPCPDRGGARGAGVGGHGWRAYRNVYPLIGSRLDFPCTRRAAHLSICPVHTDCSCPAVFFGVPSRVAFCQPVSHADFAGLGADG